MIYNSYFPTMTDYNNPNPDHQLKCNFLLAYIEVRDTKLKQKGYVYKIKERTKHYGWCIIIDTTMPKYENPKPVKQTVKSKDNRKFHTGQKVWVKFTEDNNSLSQECYAYIGQKSEHDNSYVLYILNKNNKIVDEQAWIPQDNLILVDANTTRGIVSISNYNDKQKD